ncbi:MULTISPECIES: Rv2732c family membrane protein [unclassified Corynebacterium]|uniref:Rv2732c family membrane protein n=1 Tax=unclassified Corynebacterium TaxID=2624378 RepID=UPI0030A29009
MSEQKDRLAGFRDDLRGAERKAAAELQLGAAVVPMGIAVVGLVMTYFLPHAGNVLGFDVLLNTDVAQQYFTKLPERIFSIIMLVGILMTIATILSRTTLVAFINWVVVCIQAVYSVFAGWMRQSRPPSEASEGISYGLAIAIGLSLLLAITLSFVTFKKTRFQSALETARRDEADADPVLRAQQQYLRGGSIPHTATDVTLVDDRRDRVRRRKEQRSETEK